MASPENLAAISSEGQRLLAYAKAAPELNVPQYPTWTLRDLAVHTASMHARTARICEALPRERIAAPELPDGRDALEWCQQTLAAMVEALHAADPEAEVWTTIPDGRLRAWERRMVIETGLHRWDAQQAIEDPAPLLPLVASHGLDEFADMWLPRLGDVATIEVSATDLGRSWRFGGGEPSTVVAATASDLFLGLMARPGEQLPADWERAVHRLATPAD